MSMTSPRPILESQTHATDLARSPILSDPPFHQRAFISAPGSVDTTVIRQALESRGITAYELTDYTRTGVSLASLLADCLERADLVVAVLVDGQPAGTALFELGYAMALRKRILAIGSSNEDLPITEIPFLRIATDNREAIDFGLDQVLNAPRSMSRTFKASAQRTWPLGEQADQLLLQFHQVQNHTDGHAIKAVVAQALAASGVASMSQGQNGSTKGEVKSTDLAIWSDDLDPWLGNPLLIAIESTISSREHLTSTLHQIASRLQKTHTDRGLLLYGTTVFSVQDEAVRFPQILVISIEEFLIGLKATSLGDFLRGKRNTQAHGKG